MASSRPSWLKWLLLAALIAALALGIARALNKRKTQQATAQAAALALQQPPAFQLAQADVVQVRSLDLNQAVAVSGSLKAVQTALIKAKVPGEISGMQKREGDAVKAGEVVARIDNTEAQARVRQAEQQANAAKAQMAIAQRAQDNNQSLVTKGFISPTALDNSSASLASAQANHLAALAALDIAKKSLGDTTVRSPISGLIASRLVQNGERVAVDARIFEVVDLSVLELEAALAPADAAAVRIGQSAQLTVEGMPEPVQATVARINPSVQPGSRSLLVYLQTQAVPGMRQGLFAQGQLITGQLSGLALPLSSVRNDQPQPYVQALREGRIVHVPVTLGRTGWLNGQPMLVVDGSGAALSDGTAILRAQAGAIRAGTAARMADSPEEKPAQTPANH
jgi:RND family efflux transporter MFP subunit